MGESRTRTSLKNGNFQINKETLLEAKDNYGTWYPAKVLAITEDKVHVHFCNWSSRYDTWYPLDSDNIRPLKRINTTGKSIVKSQSTSGSDSSSRSKSVTNAHTSDQFEINSYVMASWKNNYEYLAEVIAHRHRQGGRSEYRLRYVWDRVIEWTPASRLRKATPFEIDYVLKFCREHTGSATKKAHPTQRSPAANNTNGLTLSSRKDPGVVKDTCSPATRSQSKKKDISTREAKVISDSPVDQSLSVLVNNQPTEHKANTPTVLFDKVEQDDMLYDRSVAQFHEACRKRRELKRQAIEAENNAPEKSRFDLQTKRTVNGAKRSYSATVSPHLSFKLTDSPVGTDSFEKPCKVSRLTDSKKSVPDIPKVSTTPKKAESPPTMACPSPCKQSSPNHNTPSRTANSKLVSSAKSPLPTSIATSPTKWVKAESDKVTKPQPAPAILPSASPRTTPFIPSKTSPPVTYPCPYCPRQLRHSKLLAAHMENYHKDVRCSVKSRSSMRSRAQTGSSHCASTESLERTNLSNEKNGKPENNSNNRISTTAAAQEPPRFTRLLTCHRCNTRSYVTDKETGLVQCQCCLCWVHQECYSLGKASNTATELLCDGCLLSDRMVRRSRLYEPHSQWMRTGQFPWDSGSSSGASNRAETMRHLIAETSTILNWTHHLRPLLRSGWSALDKTKISDPPVASTTVTPLSKTAVATSLAVTSKADQSLASVLHPEVSLSSGDGAKTVIDGSKLNEFSPHDPAALGEDQVNLLYMELRNVAFEPPEPGHIEQSHSRSLSNPTAVDDSTFPTPDSVCAPTCWPLVGEDINYGADVSNQDSNEVTSSQVLTGFLQALGPNVMPELTDLGADPMGPEADVDDFFKPQLIERLPAGHASPSSHTSPQCSTTDTPTKGLGALLSSPSGVATVLQNTFGQPGLLQAGVLQSIITDSPGKELVRKVSIGEKRNSTCSLEDPASVSRPVNSTLVPPMVPDFFTTPLIDDLPAAHLFPSTNPLTASLNKLIPVPESTVTPTSTSLKTSTMSSTPLLHPADVDWVNMSATPGTGAVPSVPSIPYILSRSDSVNKEPTLGDPGACSVYDDLGPSSDSFDLYQHQHHLSDTVLADDFAERVTTATRELDHLDERILTPLELTLSVMENRLDTLNAELALLEHQQSHAAVDHLQSQISGNPHDDTGTDQKAEDGNFSIKGSDSMTMAHHLDTDIATASPSCSSSSSSSTRSLSPNRPADDTTTSASDFLRESSYVTLIAGQPSVLRHSQPSRDGLKGVRAKRAARRLYRFALNQRSTRSWQPSDSLDNLTPSTRTKTIAPHLFPTRNPVSSSRM